MKILKANNCELLENLYCYAEIVDLDSVTMYSNPALNDVDLTGNALSGSLDLSGSNAISTIYTRYNALTSLTLSDDENIVTIVTNDNKLSTLNVLNATAFQTLIAYNNELVSPNLSGSMGQLSYIHLENNNLSQPAVDNLLLDIYNTEIAGGNLYLNGGNNANPSYSGSLMVDGLLTRGWSIQLTPNNFDYTTEPFSGGDYIEGINYNDFLNVTASDVGTLIINWDISPKSQLNYLINRLPLYPNLGSLYINNQNKLRTVDLKGNPNLIYVELQENTNLVSVNANNCINLSELHLNQNYNLETVTISKCNELQYITLEDATKLKSLSATRLNNLNEIYITNTEMTSLTASKCPNLEYLTVDNGRLTTLDISSLPQLFEVTLENNKLTDIKIDGTSLYYLDLYNNYLPESVINYVLIQLDLIGEEEGYCDLFGEFMSGPSSDGVLAKYNLISKGWNVSTNDPLPLAYLPATQLVNWWTGADFGGDEFVDITLHDFKTVNVNDPETIYFYRDDKPLTSISNLNSYASLTSLQFEDQSLSFIDVSGCPSEIQYVNIYGNSAKTLSLSGSNCSVDALDIEGSDMSTININGFENTYAMIIAENINLTRLRISNVDNVQLFVCSANPVSSFDLQRLTNTSDIYIDNCLFTTANISNLPLTRLECQFNNITSINASDCNNLAILTAYNNPITSVNLQNCYNLHEVNFEDCNLPTAMVDNIIIQIAENTGAIEGTLSIGGNNGYVSSASLDAINTLLGNDWAVYYND
jgi:hypothetical protein